VRGLRTRRGGFSRLEGVRECAVRKAMTMRPEVRPHCPRRQVANPTTGYMRRQPENLRRTNGDCKGHCQCPLPFSLTSTVVN